MRGRSQSSLASRLSAHTLLFAAVAWGGVVACGEDGPSTPTNPPDPDPPPVDTMPTTPPPDTVTRPTVASDSVVIVAVDAGSLTLTWTPGNGTGRLVLVRAGGPVDATPVDGQTYAANAMFGAGDEVGVGNFVVLAGPGSQVAVTGLSDTTSYHVSIFEFNADSTGVKYLAAGAAQASQATPPSTGLAGSWLWGGVTAQTMAVITFWNDSLYMVVDDGVADGGGMPGMERGVFRWDDGGVQMGPLDAQPGTDTSGDWGLSDPQAKTLTVNGNELVVTIGADASAAQRVVDSATNPLVGAWLLEDPADPTRLLIITFLDDQHFVLGTDGTLGPGSGPGMERGTYSWNPNTGAFSATVTTDTNGTSGLAPLNASGTLTISGTLLTYDGAAAQVMAVRVP